MGLFKNPLGMSDRDHFTFTLTPRLDATTLSKDEFLLLQLLLLSVFRPGRAVAQR
jgi:hypothetical protein